MMHGKKKMFAIGEDEQMKSDVATVRRLLELNGDEPFAQGVPGGTVIVARRSGKPIAIGEDGKEAWRNAAEALQAEADRAAQHSAGLAVNALLTLGGMLGQGNVYVKAAKASAEDKLLSFELDFTNGVDDFCLQVSVPVERVSLDRSRELVEGYRDGFARAFSGGARSTVLKVNC